MLDVFWIKGFVVGLIILFVGAGFIPKISSNESSNSLILYDREAAYNYAENYWNEVCSDGYFWWGINSGEWDQYPLGTNIEGFSGNDCAHFVSCCIGIESHDFGGGLDIYCPFPNGPYGIPGAVYLMEWLVDESGYAVEVSSIDELEIGDIIVYDWTSGYHHAALYLGNGNVAAHTTCVWNENWELDPDNTENCHFIHIIVSSSNTDWWPMFQHDPHHSGFSTSTSPETNAVLWEYNTNTWGSRSPVVADGRVYLCVADGLCCLNSMTGEKLWEYLTGYSSEYTCPAVADEKVYFVSWQTIYCLDAITGDYLWDYLIGSSGQSSPTVVNGKVYIGSGWGVNKLYCLNGETGAWIWEYTTGGEVHASPAVADGKVYFGSNDQKAYCLDADTGAWIWEYSASNSVFTSPTVVDGKVYISSSENDGRLYCLDAATGDWIWEYTPMEYMYWSSAAVANEQVYITCNGDDPGDGLYCLNALTGEKLWNYSNSYECSTPAVADEKVYFGMGNGVCCLDAITSEKLWEYLLTDVEIWGWCPVVADGKVFIHGGNTTVYCFGEEGENHPPTPPTINGPSHHGLIGQEYEFTAIATDPDADDLFYLWDWGDDSSSEWIGPYDSGEGTTMSHSWSEEGSYAIRVKTKDVYNAESDWSESFHISISEQIPTIMLTGYWDPTGQMIAPFSTDIHLNPGGWKGANWENHGYNVYSFFPDPDGDTGDFEVDYQDTLNDFNRITTEVKPIAIISFGRGDGPWEIEFNARNLFIDWIMDDKFPWWPTPCPPDNSVPVNYIRHSSLPVQKIADAVNLTSIDAWVDWVGNPGNYLCEYMAYLGMWYQSLHRNDNTYPCKTAGFIHVNKDIPIHDAMETTNVTIREVIKYLDNDDQPPETPTITGTLNGTINTEYEYTFKAADPHHSDVNYFIDWGDGHLEWTNFYSSEEVVYVNHTWSKKGSYTVMAIAKNTDGVISQWGTLAITMPFSYPSPLKFLCEKFFERFPNAFPLLRHLMGY